MKLQFKEEPFAWIGVRTWPWTQTFYEARLWGKIIVFGWLPILIGIILLE